MPNHTSEHFGQNVQRLRKERGWTKVTLAAKSGLHRNSINEIEDGNSNPRLSTICTLAALFKTSPARLIASRVRKRVRPETSVAKPVG